MYKFWSLCCRQLVPRLPTPTQGTPTGPAKVDCGPAMTLCARMKSYEDRFAMFRLIVSTQTAQEHSGHLPLRVKARGAFFDCCGGSMNVRINESRNTFFINVSASKNIAIGLQCGRCPTKPVSAARPPPGAGSNNESQAAAACVCAAQPVCVTAAHELNCKLTTT